MSRATIRNTQLSPAVQTPEAQAYRGQTWALRLFAAVTCLLVINYALLALDWRGQSFFGTMLSQTLVVTGGKSAGQENWSGLEAGLRPGDQIIEFNGFPLSDTPTDYATARTTLSELLDVNPPGSEVTVTYNRRLPEGGTTTGTVTYTLEEMPETDFLAFFALPYGSGLVALFVGLLILYLKPKNLGTFSVSALCFLIALLTSGMFDLGTSVAMVPVWVMTMAVTGGMAVYFGLTFPSPARLVYQMPGVQYLPLAFAGLVGVLSGFLAMTPGQAQDYVLGQQLATITTFVGIAILGVCMFFFQNYYASSPATREQSGIILLGLSLTAIPVIFWFIGYFIRQFNESFALPFSLEAMTPFTIPLVISLAYSVLQHNFVNTDRLLSQSITYSILMLGLALGYFFLILGTSLFTARVVNANDPLLIALTLFVVAVLFIPIRTRLQEQVDKIYFRQRRNFGEKLEEFGRTIGTLTGYNQTIQEFRRVVNETINPVNILIFLPTDEGADFVAFGNPTPESDIRFTHDSGVAALLRKNIGAVVYLEPGKPWPAELYVDKARLSILKTMVLAGISSNNQLSSFISIGMPRSGQPGYTFEELRFLNSIIAQMSVALERAQVVNSLEQRVRQLDVLSQVGQAVNFTIEFDDLLELISAQTARLIDATHFYIALYETATKQMYFAFFLENDERFPERENKRWLLGNDLFSEIVRTGQPKRVDDYEVYTAKGGFEAIYNTENVHAWMGVPLIAQTRTLGVLAVGKSKIDDIFTSEQLKIFIDVGALAATSIDKARLFNEVNVRARQLAALNDISRKLVAAESSNVESLLHLITSSAVEILNAEAGSLLLATEDGSGDMEFRVAVGGGNTGVNLVGTRLKSGHGLVGEVIKSGQPAIANDARRDERWQGEVVEEGFHTNSLLAVPLIAKEKIIGVLEVLNKKDRTVYMNEDAELLTTFAGQAAIAIENARLFEMTGSQLSKRLKELETLERIDTELNRTLDINRVAEITVHWAVANTEATAGALGVVEGDMLRIVAAQGYNPEDFAAEWEANRWPLNQGILKRVMRFRVADLVPDVRIDPDYKQSLKGALSQITVPMLSGDEVNAVLVIETNKEPRFNLLDLDFVQRLAEHASIAISNAQLYQELMLAAETKSEFVAFAAHELKNPLTPIRGYAALLSSDTAVSVPAEQQKYFMTVIRKNAERMEGIIDDLNYVTQLEANKVEFKFQAVSLDEIVKDTLITFEKQIQDKQQTLINEVTNELPLVKADPQRLTQILVNLISNAIKYSPEESMVKVSARVDPNYRNPRGQAMGPMMHVSVQDTGIGLSEEDLSLLFKEKYFRSKNQKAREQKGTGLGMMITQGFVENMGGHIWVTSKLGEGSTFQFVIPLAPKEEQEQQAETEPASD